MGDSSNNGRIASPVFASKKATNSASVANTVRSPLLGFSSVPRQVASWLSRHKRSKYALYSRVAMISLKILPEGLPRMVALGSILREVSGLQLFTVSQQRHTCRNHPEKADGDDGKAIGS